MRFLLKIPIPTAAENPAVAEPQFNEKLRALFAKIGALAAYSDTIEGRDIEYVLVEIDFGQITPTAEQVYRALGVKPEFLPQVVPAPYYGRAGY